MIADPALSRTPAAPHADPAPHAANTRRQMLARAWPWALAAIALAGALLRLLALGNAPFAPSEAATAWPALRDALAQPVEGMPEPASALLYSLQLATFWVGGSGSDALARLPVALLGALVPALAWFWRARLGAVGALVLALLLALDPWLVSFARMSDSAALSAALALIALTALQAATPRGEEPARRSLTIAAVSMGLLLVSGPQAWSWLVVVVLGALLIGPPLPRAELLRLALPAGAAALLGATAWLAHPERIRTVAGSLGIWGAQLLPGPYPLWHPWLRLLVDQPLLLLLGLFGIIAAVRTVVATRSSRRAAPELALRAAEADARDRLLRLLLLWLGWGLLLALAPGRHPETLPVLGTALAFLAAAGVGRFLPAAVAEIDDWREPAIVAGVLCAVLLALLFLVASMAFSPELRISNFIALGGLFLLVVLLVAGYAATAGPRPALLLGGGVTSLFLLGASVAALGQLAFQHDTRHPDGFLITFALPEADNLGADVGQLSFVRTGNRTQQPVVVVSGTGLSPDAQASWQVREMGNVTWSVAPPAELNIETFAVGVAEPVAPLVITSAIETTAGGPLDWNAFYNGTSYPMRSAWLPNALPKPTGATLIERWQAGGRAHMRWLLYREAPPPVAESSLLWAPAE